MVTVSPRFTEKTDEPLGAPIVRRDAQATDRISTVQWGTRADYVQRKPPKMFVTF